MSYYEIYEKTIVKMPKRWGVNKDVEYQERLGSFKDIDKMRSFVEDVIGDTIYEERVGLKDVYVDEALEFGEIKRARFYYINGMKATKIWFCEKIE